jgi:hypothetical protein
MRTIQRLIVLSGRRRYKCVEDVVRGAVEPTWVKSIRKGQFGAMLKRIPVFQQEAVCLTKFGPESGETADEILARKDLERRSGTRAHKKEFWWGIGEKGAAQSINRFPRLFTEMSAAEFRGSRCAASKVGILELSGYDAMDANASGQLAEVSA